MKRIVWLLVLAVGLAALSAPIQAKPKKEGAAGDKPERRRKDRGAKSGLRGEYAIMVKVLNFTDTQKTELAAKLKACAENAKKWREDNADKTAELKKQQVEARKNKDKDAMKRLGRQSKALRAEEVKLRGAAIAAAKAILTPAQKQQWAGFIVYRDVMRRIKRAGLTDEQDKKVREMCNAKAKDIPADDKRARGKALKGLTATIIEAVLTPEQKEKLTAKRNPDPKKPRKGRKPKGEAPGPPV